MVRRVKVLALLLAATGMGGFVVEDDPQEMPAPVETQIRLLPGILQFDRRFPDGFGDEVVVGVLHQSRFRVSFDAMTEAVAALERQQTGGLPGGLALRVVTLDLDGSVSLPHALADGKIDVLYVTPLRGADIEALSRLCRAAGVLSFTGVPEFVSRGLAVGIGSRRGRPQILINRAAAEAEGAFFSSELLKLARIVDE